MSLLHPALLAGLVLALIPVLLHLLLKARPKRLIFPALRLIQQNRRQNVRRMQLRHLWLLLLRVGVIGLIVVALARPSLPAANYSFVWYEWLLLFLIVGVGAGSYFGIWHQWKNRPWTKNQLLTRRSMLRGVVGAVTGLLLLLGLGIPYARRVSAEIKAPAPRVAENVPVAAVFLLDTSPSMSYREENQTRLQQARKVAGEYLSRLPSGSKVAVAGSHETAPPAFSLDLQAARNRIDSFEVRMANDPLNDRLKTALLGQEDDRRRVTAEQSGPEERRQDRYAREVYLFTDLAKSAWHASGSSALRDELERLKFVSVYLIDVGPLAPKNVALTNVKLSRDTIPAGGTARVEATLTSVGADVSREQTVEFFVSGNDGKPVKKGQQSVVMEAGAETRVQFEATGVTGRFQQGELRLVGADPLALDDVGYFTVQTLPPLRITISAESAAVAKYWQSALDYIAKDKITDYQTQFIPASQLSAADLGNSDVVCLINLSAPDDALWAKLASYVESGGGLCVFLGANSAVAGGTASRDAINPLAYNSKAAQRVLPAELVASLKHFPAQTIDLRGTQHLLLKRLEEMGALAELGTIEIRRYWKVDPQQSSVTIARYNGPRASPAILEKRSGEGRVVLMTTAVDNVEWNDLVGTPWYFVFADQLTQYLSQTAASRCNYQVGSEVTLALNHQQQLRQVVLRMPDFKQQLREIPAEAKSIALRDLSSVGSYQVDASDAKIDFHRGFSLNLPAEESDLHRLEPRDLDDLLGEGRYAVSRDVDSLIKTTREGRLGQEVYSLLVAILVATFALEQFTAAWFYRTDQS